MNHLRRFNGADKIPGVEITQRFRRYTTTHYKWYKISKVYLRNFDTHRTEKIRFLFVLFLNRNASIIIIKVKMKHIFLYIQKVEYAEHIKKNSKLDKRERKTTTATNKNKHMLLRARDSTTVPFACIRGIKRERRERHTTGTTTAKNIHSCT